ncbi:hypothetical protein I8E17_27030 (plasmid) [Rhizobium sp. AB2/73]|uniref:hypothetical protein n=2 Tax=Rhizobium TaxID=379 RepID=UPI0009F35FB3|nr:MULTISPECIES: hypothetical protein [unclassified Rhizobium]QYA16865.1 hypothetical protein J5284_30730 [Rhizobium sp. AB2/73]UEQ85137.1 hypothetical protein I8E17_27030 [Rhizobium sp. AB2/73]
MALPSVSPDILAGMRLGLTVALILSIVCEMVAGRDGLGNWILLGVLGYLTPVAIGLVETRLLNWRRRTK